MPTDYDKWSRFARDLSTSSSSSGSRSSSPDQAEKASASPFGGSGGAVARRLPQSSSVTIGPSGASVAATLPATVGTRDGPASPATSTSAPHPWTRNGQWGQCRADPHDKTTVKNEASSAVYAWSQTKSTCTLRLLLGYFRSRALSQPSSTTRWGCRVTSVAVDRRWLPSSSPPSEGQTQSAGAGGVLHVSVEHAASGFVHLPCCALPSAAAGRATAAKEASPGEMFDAVSIPLMYPLKEPAAPTDEHEPLDPNAELDWTVETVGVGDVIAAGCPWIPAESMMEDDEVGEAPVHRGPVKARVLRIEMEKRVLGLGTYLWWRRVHADEHWETPLPAEPDSGAYPDRTASKGPGSEEKRGAFAKSWEEAHRMFREKVASRQQQGPTVVDVNDDADE